jgi:hypothetical protein
VNSVTSFNGFVLCIRLYSVHEVNAYYEGPASLKAPSGKH